MVFGLYLLDRSLNPHCILSSEANLHGLMVRCWWRSWNGRPNMCWQICQINLNCSAFFLPLALSKQPVLWSSWEILQETCWHQFISSYASEKDDLTFFLKLIHSISSWTQLQRTSRTCTASRAPRATTTPATATSSKSAERWAIELNLELERIVRGGGL